MWATLPRSDRHRTLTQRKPLSRGSLGQQDVLKTDQPAVASWRILACCSCRNSNMPIQSFQLEQPDGDERCTAARRPPKTLIQQHEVLDHSQPLQRKPFCWSDADLQNRTCVLAKQPHCSREIGHRSHSPEKHRSDVLFPGSMRAQFDRASSKAHSSVTPQRDHGNLLHRRTLGYLGRRIVEVPFQPGRRNEHGLARRRRFHRRGRQRVVICRKEQMARIKRREVCFGKQLAAIRRQRVTGVSL
ncbi:hypothetical protein MFFC18_11750 [Mariniblastus fucicola]|uniref:Uncharacterized protein n=1 Tax=Mariniblastus fucicola TaxID=980251 RepID=A0A5B9P6Z7_9BACT|nr:hypothetical protein MFFC18_11750 [Mariniblastus fucicola]